MSKKLQGNGIFESSRMMLPEHREAYIIHQEQLKHRTPPLIDPQAAEEMERIMASSMHGGFTISLTLFSEPEDIRLAGRVLRMDRQLRRIYWEASSADKYEWIELERIIDVEAPDEL
ncbi:YolD-like family protein [Paenibacillus pini]|uniref:YolD-like protein n=1 Tax=Paenibacillus pini JCM 16418 TaxID=1236976 RepID=W7YRJ3_9BACL|nr:YolD-like family protein [Paenibacillus pini]GAF07206.1 hypothetical protein JCM16418_1200 [Paenibacillus pini JCM 16418]